MREIKLYDKDIRKLLKKETIYYRNYVYIPKELINIPYLKIFLRDIKPPFLLKRAKNENLHYKDSFGVFFDESSLLNYICGLEKREDLIVEEYEKKGKESYFIAFYRENELTKCLILEEIDEPLEILLIKDKALVYENDIHLKDKFIESRANKLKIFFDKYEFLYLETLFDNKNYLIDSFGILEEISLVKNKEIKEVLF